MNAAIYARKSTAQDGVVEEAKSVTRQIENARAFAASRGWTVIDAHIYVDDGISGAEFKRRPGFQRLMEALEPKPPFQVLIVSEQKSIGREMSETGMAIKQMAIAGVEIFEYVHGQSLTPKNFMDKMMSAFRAGADEAHREQTSERVHESHTRLAKAGRVTGGRVFGYRNQDVFNGADAHGRPLRSHVERVIDEAEAVVVRRIFQLYDEGYGLKRITKMLVSEQAAAPKPFLRKDGLRPIDSWSPSTVRTILTRDIYHGVVVWNKSRKRPLAWGQVDQRPRPESEWVRVPAEHLRIIDEKLWLRVRSRREETEGRAARFESGRLSGRPPKHITPNLLAGLATCATCGGGLVVETSPRKCGRVPQYVCHRHRHNGTCANALHMPVADMNEAVLHYIEEHALTPEAIEQVIQLSERDDIADQRTKLEREQKDVAKRITRLVAAIEAGGDAASLVAKVRELEQRQQQLVNDMASLRPIPRLEPAVIDNRLAEWRRLLRQSTTQARTVIQRVVRGRIVFTPRADGCGYDFEAPTRFDKLFTGVATPRPATATRGDKRGWESLTAEDTLDADYGRLLDKVCGKRVASPTVPAPLPRGKRLASPAAANPFTVAGSVLRRVAA